eukprot:TRINITY_DN19003_c0_g1_i2.p1 TRINITY_DN19003_c0_g1~~TRINITY_DN19003_c0_g1_i2.p1  ORF type:complete len:179 (+),score=40.78 TRINITY_DN19003_c0_g1_i2:64-600(+)
MCIRDSFKIVHGGIRYLQQVFEFSLQGDRYEKFNLVLEALRERSYMVENAGYMTSVLPTIIPVSNFIMAGYYYIGVLVYHGIYWFASDPLSSIKFQLPKIIGTEELQSHFPKLSKEFKYGVIYPDGMMNDSRMNLDILLTATIDKYREGLVGANILNCLLYTSPSPRDRQKSRMPSSA